MGKAIDITSQVFGKLTAILNTGMRTKGNNCIWLFKCECGKDKLATVTKVKAGQIASCGCLHNWQYFGLESQLHQLFTKNKDHKDPTRNCYCDGDLIFDQFKFFTKQNCHYCGRPPSSYTTYRKTGERIYYSGLDRMYNDKPHNFDNCVPCCFTCNSKKGSMNYDEFIAWIKSIVENMGLLYIVKPINYIWQYETNKELSIVNGL